MHNKSYGYAPGCELNETRQNQCISHSSLYGQEKCGYEYNECCREGTAYQEISSTMTCASDIIEGNKKSGDTMSFVGMMLCDDKIIAFGDSKSTIVTSLGTQMADEKRGRIKKVFSCDRYVLCTYGANDFRACDGPEQKEWQLEEWLSRNIPSCNSYEKLLQRLCDIADLGAIYPDNPTSFLIGGVEKNDLFALDAHISQNGLSYQKKIVPRKGNLALTVRGWKYYTDLAQKIRERFMNATKNGEDEQILKKIIEGYIKEADEIGSYNPVGCPVDVEVWPEES